jgi:hypothetical protein
MWTKTYQEVQALSGMTFRELKEKYLEIFGEETRSHNKEFLRKRIAWRLQALAEGDLSERARKRAEELSRDADLRIRTFEGLAVLKGRPLKNHSAMKRPSLLRDPRLPLPGTLLTRQFRGCDIMVKVLDRGFEYNGRSFKSLSAIAKEVTGTQWNGFTFFALTGSGTSQKHEETAHSEINEQIS